MSVSNYAEDAVMNALFNNVALQVATQFLALHTADPGETGANEAAGGSYARQEITAKLGASSGGAVTTTADTEFAVMPAATIFGVSIWDAVSAGNCLWTGWLTGSPVVRGVCSAEADDDTFTAKGHGLVADDRVVFDSEGLGVTLPAGVSAGTVYFVLASGLTTDAFKISTTSGGSAVNVTADGNASFLKVVPKVVNAGDTFRVATGQLTVQIF